MTGYVKSCDDVITSNNQSISIDEKEIIMKTRDIYKELKLRGYQYNGVFRSLKNATTDGTKGTILWKNNWVAFMDNMLQIKIISGDTRGLFVPTGIAKLVIDPKSHINQIQSGDSQTVGKNSVELN